MNTKKNSHFKVGLVMPVFNVEKTISKVLESVSHFLEKELFDILIIDNNSNDKTISIIQQYLNDFPKLARHTTLIQHEINYGYGCSVKAGFDYFSSRPVSHVMVIHGDHQVDPAWLMGKLIGTVKSNPEPDLVLASRFKPESNIDNYSGLRKLGNYFFNTATTLCSGHRMSDSGAAMIIVRNDILKKIPFHTLSNSWQFHPQLNIHLYSIPHIRIQEIPMNWADSDADSTVPLFRYGFILLKLLLLHWFKKNILKKSIQETFPLEPIPAERTFAVLASHEDENYFRKVG